MTTEYARVEPYERELECEHADTVETGELIPCREEAQFTISTPLWSDETRTRYCLEHALDRLEVKLEGWEK